MGTARFDPSSHHVVGASWDGTAWVWQVMQPYRQWSSSPIARDCIGDISLDAQQRFLAVNCTSHVTHIWDTAHDQLLARLPSGTSPDGPYRSAFTAISAAGDRAAIAIGNTVAIYALGDARLLRTVTHPAGVTAIAFSKSGHDVVSGGADGSLLFTPDGGDSFALPGLAGGVNAVAITPDRRLLIASPRGRLRVHDLDRNTIITEADAPNRVVSLRLSADGRRLIIIASTLPPLVAPALWDLDHYRLVAHLDGHVGAVFSARFVDGDQAILTAGGDGIPRLWDSVTGRLKKTYLGNDKYLLDAALDPDGVMIVGGGGDGVLRFWHAASGRMLWTLRAHRVGILGVHFEGVDIVTRGFTGEVSRWNVSKLPPVETIDRAARCLPLRFDENTGGLVEQTPACELP